MLLFQIIEFSNSFNEELKNIYPTISINKVESYDILTFALKQNATVTLSKFLWSQ
jgi:hypothetical protein